MNQVRSAPSPPTSITISQVYPCDDLTVPVQNGRKKKHRQEVWLSYDNFQKQDVKLPRVGDIKNVEIPQSLRLIRSSGRYRALLIGINYTGTPWRLRGCINDARNMRHLLMQNGYPDDSSHMVMLTDHEDASSNYKATASNIIKAMQWLVQGASYGDSLFFHFSGHGSQAPDLTEQESDGLNETILPLDYKDRQITDDELWGNLVYPLPNGTRLTAVMDCCHSGTGLDLPYEYKLKKDKQLQKNCDTFGGALKGGDSDWILEINPAFSRGDVILLSGCEDAQTSTDVEINGCAGGAMTCSFIKAYKQASENEMTFPKFLYLLHRMMKTNGFRQRPQLTSSQPFDLNTRKFSLTEGIEPNHNYVIGRLQRRRIEPDFTHDIRQVQEKKYHVLDNVFEYVQTLAEFSGYRDLQPGGRQHKASSIVKTMKDGNRIFYIMQNEDDNYNNRSKSNTSSIDADGDTVYIKHFGNGVFLKEKKVKKKKSVVPC